MSHWMFEMLPEGAFEPRPGGGMRLHGGKGGSQQMQAPDPALVAAQIKSMGIQDDAIEKIMANNDMMQPIQTVLRSPQQFPPACCMTYYLPQRGYIRVYLQSTRDITAEEAPLRVRCVFKGIKLPSTALAAVRNERGETVGVRLQQRLNMLVERSGL